jgi:hypothetical protein
VARNAVLFGILISAIHLFAQQPVQRGVDQAERAETQNQRNIPPPMNQQAPVDVAKLSQNAHELAALAQSVPSEIEQATNGVLPKDLGEKLKRIEKLAKQLRSQISQ